ncbi:MAG: YIP1 family protein [Ruminococcus sp.]|nr:YIP1 family protein [Ruminococcus sp.]
MMDLTQKQWVKHTVFHPFEGFEDLRWKKGGSVLFASIVIVLWFIGAILYENFYGQQFIMSSTKMFNIVPFIVQTIVLFLTWVVGNWSICTLLEGEGTMKKIYIYSAYALIPYVVQLYIQVIMSHFMTRDEAIFITTVEVIGVIWSVVLMFMAIKAVHQYSVSKTILAIILTIVAMLLILVLLVLLVALFQQVYVFATSVYTEISYRMKV